MSECILHLLLLVTCLKVSRGIVGNTCSKVSRSIVGHTCLKVSRGIAGQTCQKASHGIAGSFIGFHSWSRYPCTDE